MLDPRGRVVMVSGASRGIGRAVVDRLLAAGFTVSAGVRDPRGLADGDRLQVQRYDAESAASPQDWVEATAARWGRIDALVNAAGINTMATIADPDETALDALWLVNVKAPLRLIRLAWPHLTASGSGRVVNVASLSGKRVANANIGYAMTKHALVALTHRVRQEGFDSGIRATALCPGFVATDMTTHVNSFPRAQMSDPRSIAELTLTALTLPNDVSVAELLVNCRAEHGL
jgi:NAD(P)-dependent dehydrogenase (short-subunit alcohol dehydrogenase family)